MKIYELLVEMTPEEQKKFFLKKRKPFPKVRARPPADIKTKPYGIRPPLDDIKTKRYGVKEEDSMNLGPLKGRIISQDDLKKLLNDFNEKNGHWPSIDETVELLLQYAGDDDVTVVGEDSSGGGGGGGSGGATAGGATAGATSAGNMATYASQVGIANVGPRGVGTGGKKTKKRKTGSRTPNPVGGLVPYGTV